jgi:hypothetical protein
MVKINTFKFVTMFVVSVFSLSSVTSEAVVALQVGPGTDQNISVTSAETKEALSDIPGILGSSSSVVAKTDTDSAMITVAAGTTVDVPKDAEQGVIFGAIDGPKLEVELPNNNEAGIGKSIAPGVVAYDSGDGSANAVQASDDGTVRMLTIIDNPTAPAAYDYKVTVPDGGHVELIKEGGAIVVDSDGELLYAIDAPWAKDANRSPVRTWFTTDGQTLTQHVEHNGLGVVYPVTADPAWVAVLGAGVLWAAYGCAGNAAQGFIWSGAKWAVKRGDWYWNQKVREAADNCATGAVFGPAGRFIPGWVKSAVKDSIRPLIVNYLLWLVKR